MAMLDLKRLPDSLITAVARQAPYRGQRSFGSVALDWCWVNLWPLPGILARWQRLWTMAGQLVLSESGAVGRPAGRLPWRLGDVLSLRRDRI